jgi:hypothetical protein
VIDQWRTSDRYPNTPANGGSFFDDTNANGSYTSGLTVVRTASVQRTGRRQIEADVVGSNATISCLPGADRAGYDTPSTLPALPDHRCHRQGGWLPLLPANHHADAPPPSGFTSPAPARPSFRASRSRRLQRRQRHAQHDQDFASGINVSTITVNGGSGNDGRRRDDRHRPGLQDPIEARQWRR